MKHGISELAGIAVATKSLNKDLFFITLMSEDSRAVMGPFGDEYHLSIEQPSPIQNIVVIQNGYSSKAKILCGADPFNALRLIDALRCAPQQTRELYLTGKDRQISFADAVRGLDLKSKEDAKKDCGSGLLGKLTS